MKMNLANKLTIFRIPLLPVIMLIPIIDNLVGIPGEFLGISTAFWIITYTIKKVYFNIIKFSLQFYYNFHAFLIYDNFVYIRYLFPNTKRTMNFS